MSKPRYSTIPAGALTDDRLNMTDIRVLGMLGTFNWNKGWCFPKQDTIADALKRSRPVINASLARLEACGYVESQKKKGGANRKLYRVVLDLKDDSPDLPDGMFEAERDVGHTDISKPKAKARDVRHADMSTQSTCLSGRHVSEEMSAPQTIDVGPADMQRELAKPNKQKKERVPRLALTPLPESWEPRDAEVDLAQSLNFSKAQFDRMLAQFRQHWLERAHLAKGKHANWDLTFQKWVENQARYWNLDRQKPSPWKVPTVNVEPNWPKAIEDWLANKGWPTNLGPKPHEPGYRGPLEPLRNLVAGKNPNHPVIAAVLAKIGEVA